MEKLTAQQAKMVLEYFARQAAEDAPQLPLAYDRHMWMTRFQASLAIERQLQEYDWDELVTVMIAYESFERDPDGYLHQNGYKVTAAERDYQKGTLQDEVSFAIDNCFANSGA
jgi:hypothetical protein